MEQHIRDGQPVGSGTLLKAAGLPVVVGSGVSPRDAGALGREAQALIVGSWLKEDGDWRRPVDLARVRQLRAALDCGKPGAPG